MICDGCKNGKHCGKPDKASPHCPCQHRNPGAWKGVKPVEPSAEGNTGS